MWKSRIAYLITLICAFLFYVFYNQYYSWFFMLIVLLLPLFSLALGYCTMKNCHLVWDAHLYHPHGQPGEAVLSIQTKGNLPCGEVTLILKEDRPFTHRPAIRLKRRCIPGGSVTVPLCTDHCDHLHITVIKAKVCDCLGLFSRRIPIPSEISCYVLPQFVPPDPIPDLELMIHRSPVTHAKPGGGFAEDYDLREYRPGDPMRAIHWKLTSKTDDVIVKEPLEQLPAPVLLPMVLGETSDEADRALGETAWLLDGLTGHNVTVTVWWEQGGYRQRTVRSQREIEAFLCAVLTGTSPVTATTTTKKGG